MVIVQGVETAVVVSLQRFFRSLGRTKSRSFGGGRQGIIHRFVLTRIGSKREVGEDTTTELYVTLSHVTETTKEIDRYIDTEGPEVVRCVRGGYIECVRNGEMVLLRREQYLRLYREILGDPEIHKSA